MSNAKTKSKRVYSFDIDGVVASTEVLAIKKFNELYKKNKKVSDLKKFHIIYDWIKEITGDEEKAEKETVKVWNDPDVLFNTKPQKGALNVISRVSKSGNTIHFVTSRPSFTKQITLKWFKKWFPNIDKKFIHINESGLGLQRSYKAQKIASLSPDVHFEDSFEHASDIAELLPNTKIVLVRQPWNFQIDHKLARSIIVPPVKSCGDLVTVYEYFLKNQ